MQAEASRKMTVYSFDNDAGVERCNRRAVFSGRNDHDDADALFDGNRIVNSSTIKAYRDQQGPHAGGENAIEHRICGSGAAFEGECDD